MRSSAFLRLLPFLVSSLLPACSSAEVDDSDDEDTGALGMKQDESDEKFLGAFVLVTGQLATGAEAERMFAALAAARAKPIDENTIYAGISLTEAGIKKDAGIGPVLARLGIGDEYYGVVCKRATSSAPSAECTVRAIARMTAEDARQGKPPIVFGKVARTMQAALPASANGESSALGGVRCEFKTCTLLSSGTIVPLLRFAGTSSDDMACVRSLVRMLES